MFDAVILAVQGVLVPRLAFQHAAIDAAANCLAAHGVPPQAFRRTARRRLATSGQRALVSCTLADMHLCVAPAVQRRAVLASRVAGPTHTLEPESRQALRVLGSRRVLGFFDKGPAAVLETLIEHLGLTGLPVTTLWAESLGGEARPGRALPFRWLSRRLRLPAARCLHVTTAGPARDAARRAGWQVWPAEPAPEDGPLDLWPLVDWLDGVDAGSESTWT